MNKNLYSWWFFSDKNEQELTEMSHVPRWIDGGVTFVKNNEEGWSDDAFCECFTVQILTGEKKTCSFVRTKKRPRIKQELFYWL